MLFSYFFFFFFFFFNDTATTEIYTLSLHDALPTSTISPPTPLNSTVAPISSGATAWTLRLKNARVRAAIVTPAFGQKGECDLTAASVAGQPHIYNISLTTNPDRHCAAIRT